MEYPRTGLHYRIGNEALLNRRHHPSQRETPGSMSKVELYTSCPRFVHIRIQLAFVVQKSVAICQAMSHDIAWTHFLEEKLTVAPCGKFPLGRLRSKVRQNREPGQAASFDNGVHRGPGEARITERSSVVPGLESDDELGIFLRGIRRKLHFELSGILFRFAGLRPRSRDIQKGKDSHSRAVNNPFELFKAIGACSAAVAAGGHSRWQAMMIGNDRGSQVEPGVETTDVQVDQTGRHV